MSDLRKAAEMAVKALSIKTVMTPDGTYYTVNEKRAVEAIEALRQALAQPDEVLTEREACAKVCEERGIDAFDNNDLIYNECAELIRAREKNT
jgi:hypothetical protein